MKKHFSKLTKMSANEVSFRINQKLRQYREKFLWKFRNSNSENIFIPRWIQNLNIEEYSHFPKQIQFFGIQTQNDELIDFYNTSIPNSRKKSVIRAEQLLYNKFHFLGVDVEFTGEIQWNENPCTKASYLQTYYKNLNVYDTQKYDDVKYVWELNRHQYLIELAKAYFVTNDEKYVEKVGIILNDWISQNPYKIGVNWTSALEAAVRIFSWIWAFFFTEKSQIWTPERKTVLIKNLLLHGSYIEENLSYYYSPYNHLIGELAALSLLGIVCPELPGSKEWRDKYWFEMEAQIVKQFHPDGFTIEQAAYYHHFTLGFYLMIALLRKQNNLTVSPNVWKKLEQALEIVMYMTRPDRHLPMIGDIDNARSVYFYYPEDQWNLRAFLALGAVIFDRSDMKYVAGDINEEVLWLLGFEGVEKYQQLQAVKPEFKSKAFSNSGYFIMRDGWEDDSNYCCFDCGEIAHGLYKNDTPSTAHGHADILSFEICIDGKPIIIDPGFYTYFGPRDWHKYFRSTQGHNTITVNGCGQANHEGPISWSNVSSAQLIHLFSSDQMDFVSGKIDRFADLENGIYHRRYILFYKSFYFLVMDEVLRKESEEKKYTIESFTHFSQNNLLLKDRTVYLKNKKPLYLAIPNNSEVTTEIGGGSPDQGWMASGYGYKQPAPVLKISTNDNLPVSYGMLFPTEKIQNSIMDFSMNRKMEGIIEYHITTSTWEENVYLNPSRKLFYLPEAIYFQTDALCVAVRKESPELFKIYAIQVTNVLIDNKGIINREQEGIGLVLKSEMDYTIEFNK